MLEGVDKIGMVLSAEIATGTGPQTVRPQDREVLYLFRFRGWDSNASAEGQEDERVGHLIAERMRLVGEVSADEKVTADEIVKITSVLYPKLRAGDEQRFDEVASALKMALGGEAIDASRGVDILRALLNIAGAGPVGGLLGIARGLVSTFLR